MNLAEVFVIGLSMLALACRGEGTVPGTRSETDLGDVAELVAEDRAEDLGSEPFESGRVEVALDSPVREDFDTYPDSTDREAFDAAPDADVQTKDALQEDCVSQGRCTLPASWERTLSVTLELDYSEPCPDVNGDGIGDNALGKTHLACLSWRTYGFGFPCVIEFVESENPLSPVVLQHDGPTVLESLPPEIGRDDSFDLGDYGTGVSLLAVRPVTFQSSETKVLVSPSSYADSGCGGICEPKVHFRGLRCEWCENWTYNMPFPRYQSEVIEAVEVALPSSYGSCFYLLDQEKRDECFEEFFEGLLGGDDTKTTTVTLRNLVLRLGGGPTVVAGIISLEDIKRWWDSTHQGTPYPIQFFEQLWDEIESAADVDLDKDGANDAATFCLYLGTRRTVEVVGLLPPPD